LCNLFLEIYKPVGLKDARSHSRRRTYITRLANKGVGVRVAAAHSSIALLQLLLSNRANSGGEPQQKVTHRRLMQKVLYSLSPDGHYI